MSNNVAKQAIKDCCNAYKNFFKGLAYKPKFKSRKKSKPSFYNDTSKLKAKEKSVLENGKSLGLWNGTSNRRRKL